MGIYLFPVLKDGFTNADIIGTSNEVYNNYLTLKAKYDNNIMSPDEYYELIYSDGMQSLNELNHFDLFGFGKFNPLPEMKTDNGYIPPCGEITDKVLMYKLFDHNRFFGYEWAYISHFIDKVCWC